MNKNKIIITILSAFVMIISFNFNYVKAQDFTVPPPKCTSVPEAGLTCPDDLTPAPEKQKISGQPKTNLVFKSLTEFANYITKILNGILLGIKDALDNAKDFFNKIFYK